MFRCKTHKSARFGATVPFDFLAKRKRFFKFSAPNPPSADKRFELQNREVAICREILSFARTYFQSKTGQPLTDKD